MSVAFVNPVVETFAHEGISISKKHCAGVQYAREHFVYVVTGTRDDLQKLNLCAHATFPEGRKRFSCGWLDDRQRWVLSKVKTVQRWSLELRLHASHPAIESLIMGAKLRAAPARGHLRLVWSAPAA